MQFQLPTCNCRRHICSWQICLSCPSEALLISNFAVLFCVYTFAHTYMYIGLDLYLMRALILLLVGGKGGETVVDFDSI